MPLVKINRESQFADAVRAYQIYVDGEKKSEIRCGETQEFFVPPGNYRISLKIDWCGSPEIEFSVGAEENVEFDCGNNTKGFLAGFYALFMPKDYLWLKKR